MKLLIFWILLLLHGHNAQGAKLTYCTGELPRIQSLTISSLVVGHPTTFRLNIEHPGRLTIRWVRTIWTDARYPDSGEENYRVPVLYSRNYQFHNSHSGRTFGSILNVNKLVNRREFTAEITVEYQCNVVTVYVDAWRNISQPDTSTVKMTFPADSNRVPFAENVQGELLVEYFNTEKPSHDPTLSIRKWKRYMSRAGTRNYLFVFDKKDHKWNNITGRFFLDRGPTQVVDGKFQSKSVMRFLPFFERDQGVFLGHFSYKIDRRNTVKVNVYTELRYSDRLGAALKVKTCSSRASNELSNEMLDLPVEAGYENCIRCFAHASPAPSVYLASINSDIATGIQFKTEVRGRYFGHLTRSQTYALAPMHDGVVQHYVCTAGRKHYVSSYVFKVSAYTKVNMTHSTPSIVHLNTPGVDTLHFTCQATGFPIPEIDFYFIPKNSALIHGKKPEDTAGWVKINEGPDAAITTVLQGSTSGGVSLGSVTSDLRLKNATSIKDISCVARNKYSFKYRALRVDG